MNKVNKFFIAIAAFAVLAGSFQVEAAPKRAAAKQQSQLLVPLAKSILWATATAAVGYGTVYTGNYATVCHNVEPELCPKWFSFHFVKALSVAAPLAAGTCLCIDQTWKSLVATKDGAVKLKNTVMNFLRSLCA